MHFYTVRNQKYFAISFQLSMQKYNVEASWSFLLYSHVYNINLERDSIKAYTRKCGYLGTGSRFAHSSRKYLLTLLIVMTGYVYTYHQCCAGLLKGVYTNFSIIYKVFQKRPCLAVEDEQYIQCLCLLEARIINIISNKSFIISIYNYLYS